MESTGGFNKGAFKMLAEAEEKSVCFNARNRLIVRRLKKYFPDMKNILKLAAA